LFIFPDKDTDLTENLSIVFDHPPISLPLFYYISREKNSNLCPMRRKMSIRSKMLVYILTVSALIYIVAVGYISLKLKSNALEDARDKIDAMAGRYAYYTKSELNVDMDMSRTLAQTLETYQDKPMDEWEGQQKEILKNLIGKNPNFLSVWAIWELKDVLPGWEKPYGRARHTWYRSNGQLNYRKEVLDTTAGFEKGAYYRIMDTKAELVMDPYYFSYTGDASNQNYETSVGAPILNGNRFVGLAGADLSLERFQPVISRIKPYPGSYAFLISHNGTYIAHPNEAYIGKNYADTEKQTGVENLIERIQTGEAFSFTGKGHQDDQEHYVSFSPVVIGKSNTPWSFGLSVPVHVVTAQARQAFQNAVWVGLVGLLLVALVIWLMANHISRPIQKTTAVLGNLAKGKVNPQDKLDDHSNDEVGQMSRSVNTLIDGLDKTASFAREIGRGNLDTHFKLLSEEDMLGNRLMEMRESLKKARENEEQRKNQEEKQNWATTGLARFGDILRQHTDEMNEFAYSIISNLVSYVEADQGGLYVINDDDSDDRYIEMLACYAYDRRKMIEKRIGMGEGLVGQAVQEQERIYLEEIPQEYVNITSGLGHTTPRCLLIVPLKVNDEVFGAIELASIKPMEDHVVHFVEDVAEDIASTLKTTKINLQTSRLLEQSQQQSEELAAQEEEMRQNMEELKATQEESARRNAEIEGLVGALRRTNVVIEYDLQGYIRDANENFLNLVGMKKEEVIGLHHFDHMEFTEEKRKHYERFWEDLRQGQTRKETNTIRVNGNKYTFIETYTPIMDQYGQPEKILKIATDITDVGSGSES
jgi:methyl-accepting chemotaxis protein